MKRHMISPTSILAVFAPVLHIAPGTMTQKPSLMGQTRQCGPYSLKGSYGFTYVGNIMPPAPGAGPAAAVGVWTFDGQVNTTGAERANFSGDPVTADFAGTYTVEADCTGTITATFPDDFTAHFYFVIVEKGKEGLFVQTDAGSQLTGTLNRQ